MVKNYSLDEICFPASSETRYSSAKHQDTLSSHGKFAHLKSYNQSIRSKLPSNKH